ncbi:MAG: hypothetical protein R3229_01840 [Alphaproteobacteria bacterium]|nr:hypothetical protein [Alphaproteobacteria bacterium]
MTLIRVASSAALALAGLSGMAVSTSHADVADFYKRKVVRIVVGASPGGGFDAYSRLMARHMKKHVPGAPKTIVSNMPGAGSLKAVQSLKAAPKDGTVMVAFNPGLVTQSVVTPDKVRFKFTDVSFLGSVTADIRVCYTWGKTGIKNFKDLLARDQVNLGATSKGSSSYLDGAILRNMFGAKIRHVIGYPGSTEQRIAIERGELDGDCGSWGSIPRNWIERKLINVIVRNSTATISEIPASVPFVLDLAKSEADRAVLKVVLAANDVFRPLIMAKQVPAERLAAMRKAVWDTVNDPAFRAEAQRSKREIVNPMRGEDVDKVIAEVYRTPADLIAKAARVIR